MEKTVKKVDPKAVATVLEKYTHRLEMDNSMLNSQNDYPSRLLLREIDELKIIIEALQFQQELVKCKDCKYITSRSTCDYWSSIEWFGRFTDDDEFCSKGERRDEN